MGRDIPFPPLSYIYIFNPIHTDVFNELIENLKEKNPTWNKTTFNYERPVTRSLFMEENSDGDR